MKRANIFGLLMTIAIGANSQVEQTPNYSFNGIKYDLFIIKAEASELLKFDIVSNDNGAKHKDYLGGLLATDSAFFLTNACISDTLGKPIGLLIKNSQVLKPANMGSGEGNYYLKPNGAILFTPDDVIICESSLISNHKNVRLGVQSGPLLLSGGTVHPKFVKGSNNKFLRCGAGVYFNNKNEKFLIFALAKDPVSFYDFAMLFKRYKCIDALCLESQGCAMYFQNRGYSGNEYDGAISNYIYYKQ